MGIITKTNHDIISNLLKCWQIDESNEHSTNIINHLQKILMKSNYNLFSQLDIKKEDLLGNFNQYITKIETWYNEELQIKLDDNDKKIIYTGLWFLPLWYDVINKSIFINQKEIEKSQCYINIDTTQIENDFKQFYYYVLLYYKKVDKFQDWQNQDELQFIYYRILDTICNHCNSGIKWNNMAEDWDILRPNAIVRDMYITIIMGMQFNQELDNNYNIFNLDSTIYDLKWFHYLTPQEKESFLTQYHKKLQLEKKLFFSEYFATKINLIPIIKKLKQEYFPYIKEA